MKMLLFACIVLIGVLALIRYGNRIDPQQNTAVPGRSEAANRVDCIHNLKQIYVALTHYADNYRGLPEQSGFAGLEELRKVTTPDTKIFVCPSSGKTPAKDGEVLSEKNCSYIYFGGLSGMDMNPFCRLPIVMEIPGNHDGYFAFLRSNGKVECIVRSKATTAEEMVCYPLGKRSGFDKREQMIVDQAKAWDRGVRR